MRNINYMRNSVKATIDAYTGKTNIYVFDEKDPVIEAYWKLFPSLMKPASEMPASLRESLLTNPNPALLEKLFDTFGPNWWMQRRPYTFRLAQEYDRMLPAHCVL